MTLLVVSLFSVGAIAQTLKVTGKVTDSKTGEGLPGVSVIVKGTTNGVATDIYGAYSINASKGATLEFSFVGYSPFNAKVEGTTLNVQLTEAAKAIDEIVVIGYGTVKKSDATGAVQAVGSKDFNKGAISTPQQLLSGKSAGVVITSEGGRAGSATKIRIRGESSLNASSNPLVVIDGVPMSSDDLNAVNPNDIESFTILKDAASTAIYGSRATTGVIMITTKKGRTDSKLTVAYNGSSSISYLPKTIDVLNGDEYRALIKDLAAKKIAGVNDQAVKRLGSANTDWQDEVYRTAFSTDQNIAIQGSYKGYPYRVSYGYRNENGVLKRDNFERNSLAVSFNPSFLNDYLKLTVNARGSKQAINYSEQDAVGAAIAYDPTQVIRDGSKYGGYFTWTNLSDANANGSNNSNGQPNPIGVSNPVSLINQTDNTGDIYKFIGNAQVDYKFHFLPELKATLNAALDYTESHYVDNAPNDAAWTYRGGIGKINNSNKTNRNELLDIYLNYNKTIGNHVFDATAGYSYQWFWNRERNYDASSVKVNRNNIISKNESYLLSFFGRLNYTFLDRYYLSATVRADGSSKFYSGGRWGQFPSVAVGWKINKEEFLANTIVNDLKLRASWGITGQQAGIGEYGYIPYWTISEPSAAYQFGDKYVNTYRPAPYDAKLKWETTTTYNIGTDFGIFNNRVSGSVDVYLRKTKDLLSEIPIAAGTNFSNYLITNVGDMENKGIDFALNLRPIQQKDLNWNVSYNINYNKNEITKLTKFEDPNFQGIEKGGISGGNGNNVQVLKVGYPIYSYQVFQQVYDPKTGMPIEGLYVDRTGKGGSVIAENSNKYLYKQPNPTVSMGISSSLQYKNWDLSFAGRVYLDNYVYNNVASDRATYASAYNQSGYLNNVPTAVNKTKFASPQYWSDFYVENGSFFRMDNISLGYCFNKLFTEKLSGKITASVNNAFVITNYSGLDPEVSGGIDNSIYPRPRIFTLGLNINFK
jgi:TonB-dependent starch-binding outer membrane protein SusC